MLKRLNSMLILSTVLINIGYTDSACPAYIIRAGWDFYSNDLSTPPYQFADVAGCCANCSATPGCTTFTYYSTNQNCYLKRSTGNGGAADGSAEGGYIPDTCSNNMVRLDGYDIGGGDISGYPVTVGNQSECCSRCMAQSGCTAFVYQGSSSLCWAKALSSPTLYVSNNLIAGIRRFTSQWNTFQDSGCVANCKRRFSATAQNIPPSAAVHSLFFCQKTPATIDSVDYTNPSNCAESSGVVTGHFDITDSACCASGD